MIKYKIFFDDNHLEFTKNLDFEEAKDQLEENLNYCRQKEVFLALHADEEKECFVINPSRINFIKIFKTFEK